MNLPTIVPIQTPKLRQDQEESEKIYASMLQFKKIVEDRDDEINELRWKIASPEMQKKLQYPLSKLMKAFPIMYKKDNHQQKEQNML